MSEVNSSTIWIKKQREHARRLRLLGWGFLLLALGSSACAFIADYEMWVNVLPLPNVDDLESYYMMSIVFMCMGIVCFMPTRNKM